MSSADSTQPNTGESPTQRLERTFSLKATPIAQYQTIKGVPKPMPQGLSMFTDGVYHGYGPPDSALGQPSDIFLDKASNSPQVFVKLTDDGWTQWPVPTASSWAKVFHPLFPVECKVLLWAHSTKGIHWTSYHGAHTDKNRMKNKNGSFGDAGICIKRTLQSANSGQLPSPAEGGGESSQNPAAGGGEAAVHKRTRTVTPIPQMQTVDGAEGEPLQNLAAGGIEGHPSSKRARTLTPFPQMQKSSGGEGESSQNHAAGGSQEERQQRIPTPQPQAPIGGGGEDYPMGSHYGDIDHEMGSPASSELTALPEDCEDEIPATPSLLQTLRKTPDIFVEGRAGIEYPKRAKTTAWTCGVNTVIPWANPKNVSPFSLLYLWHYILTY
jgi:hypothetical protein